MNPRAMKIKIIVLAVVTILFVAVSCEKNDHSEPPAPKYCWMLIDQAGNRMGKICDRTEKEMADTVVNPCNYYKLGGEEFCWLLDGKTYLEKEPEEYAKLVVKCFGMKTYKKVECGYCSTWYSRQKNIYKPANTATYGQVKVGRLCGDTVKTLYNGRKITLRESADSLIVLEIANNVYFN